MRGLSVVFLIVGVTCQVSFGQISREDALPLFGKLGNEDFEGAHQLSGKLLKEFKKDTTYMMGIVRYAFLYSGAALISTGKMTYKELRSKSKQVAGKFILMPGHPTTTDTTTLSYNTNVLKMDGGRAKCSVVTSNSTNTSIYFFEYFEFMDDVSINDFEGKDTRCGGMLDHIEFNPNGSTIWIMRLYIKDAMLREM